MASQSRKVRGRRSEKVLAEYYALNGWPFAESTGAGRSGVDVTGMPGLAVEVKARRAFDPMAWLKQAASRAGVPFVVFRPNGMGEQSVGKWGVLMTVDHHMFLLHEAGYGDPSGVTEDGDDQRKSGDHQESDGGEAQHKAHPSGDAFVHSETHGTESTPA